MQWQWINWQKLHGFFFFTAAGNARVCLIWGRSWGYKKLLYDSCTDYWHRRRNKDNKDVADMGRCCCSTFSVTYVIQRKIMSIKITSLLKPKKTICFCWHFLKCVICHSAFPAVCLPLLSPKVSISHLRTPGSSHYLLLLSGTRFYDVASHQNLPNKLHFCIFIFYLNKFSSFLPTDLSLSSLNAWMLYCVCFCCHSISIYNHILLAHTA